MIYRSFNGVSRVPQLLARYSHGADKVVDSDLEKQNTHSIIYTYNSMKAVPVQGAARYLV